MFIDTGCVFISSVASKKTHHQTIGKNPHLEKNAYRLVILVGNSDFWF
jgi:hypothetical protein